MNKKRRTFNNEINPGSMADIGFLLLIFFLVSTTIDVDKGILVKLPSIDNEPTKSKIIKRNLCTILVNKDNELLVRGKEMEPNQLTSYLKEFILNEGGNSDYPVSPKKAVISLQNDRATSYEVYIEVYNEIRKAYNELRDKRAQTLYDKPFASCNKSQRTAISQMIPMIISEADPIDLNL